MQRSRKVQVSFISQSRYTVSWLLPILAHHRSQIVVLTGAVVFNKEKKGLFKLSIGRSFVHYYSTVLWIPWQKQQT